LYRLILVHGHASVRCQLLLLLLLFSVYNALKVCPTL